MKLDPSLPAFFDELTKIATANDGDLMTPAVVSDSATVDGPPATPFTKRKGFRKLERFAPVKEAGVKDFFRGAVKLKKTVTTAAEKARDRANLASAKLYTHSPQVVRNVIHDMAENPGSYASTPQAFGNLPSLLRFKP